MTKQDSRKCFPVDLSLTIFFFFSFVLSLYHLYYLQLTQIHPRKNFAYITHKSIRRGIPLNTLKNVVHKLPY